MYKAATTTGATPKSAKVIDRLEAAFVARDVGPGTCLFDQGEDFAGMYRIESGLVGLRKLNEDGSTMLVGLARPGDFVGFGPLLNGGEHQNSAEVLKASRISFVAAGRARALIREEPALVAALLRQATRDLAALEERHLQMVTRKAHARLAALLVTLGCGAGARQAHESCCLTLPILNRDIADLIGIRPETLSRAIAQLRALGVATWNGREVSVADVSELMEVAGCSESAGMWTHAAA